VAPSALVASAVSGPGSCRTGGVLSQATTVAETVMLVVRWTGPSDADNETEPETGPGAVAASCTVRLSGGPAIVLLGSADQVDGNVMVPIEPTLGVLVTPVPDTLVTDTVTTAPLANTLLLTAPLRCIPTSAGFVTVEPAQTVPKARPFPRIGVAPSPSDTTLSAQPAAGASRWGDHLAR